MKSAAIFSALGHKSFTHQQRNLLRKHFKIAFIPCLTPLSQERFIKIARPFEHLAITRRTLLDFNKGLIQQLPSLKGLAIYATGFEWIDVETLLQKGVKISYLPDYSTTTVAEHAMACLLTLSRRIHLSFDRVRERIPSSVSLRGWELRGKTLGIIGNGKIGRKVTELAKAFGMKVVWTDPHRPQNKGSSRLGALLNASDAVLLSASYRRSSQPLIGEKELHRLRPGAVLVNVARASLVDHPALLRSIKAGKLAGYAIDDNLKLLNKTKGIEPGRILQTAHTGWYSTEAIQRGTQAWVENLVALGLGRPRNLLRHKDLR